MDQLLTGQFIKALRKERGLTQKELAEKLNVSEKTVSKWETGNGLPDVGLMLPLSKELGISVNELLSGERLDERQYIERAEENFAVLLEDKCSPKTKNTVALISFLLTLLSTIGLIVVCAGYADIETWLRIMLVVCAIISVIANVALCLVLGISSEIFECPECGTKFAPTPRAYIAGMHDDKTKANLSALRKKELVPQHVAKIIRAIEQTI